MTGDKKEVVKAGRELHKRNLVVGTWGNISVRLEEDRNKFAITPSGMDYEKINEDDIVILNLDGKVIEGKRDPSSEVPLHRFIYKKRADVNAILHTHSTYASAVACTRQEIPPILEDMIQIVGGNIETAEYELPGSEELAQAAINSLGEKNAALLANHGAISVGKNMDIALKVAEIVEKSAKIYLIANQTGNINELSEEDVEMMKKIHELKFR